MTPPRIVATGFTTGFLGDERTLREFIVGDHVRGRMEKGGERAALILVNDTYDPLDIRQLRIAVNKSDTLVRRFEPFCGRPIAEVPDPYECHENYGAHFMEALRTRLQDLAIHPSMFDTYQAYRGGRYRRHIAATLENYQRIQEGIARTFDGFHMKNLLRPMCERCSCIDATVVKSAAAGGLDYDCTRCGRGGRWELERFRGKLSWKLDCAARWNIYGIDVEVFSRTHLTDLGTLGISQFISREFYGGRVPSVVRYGEVKISRELSGRLLDMVPPAVLKPMFLGRLRRDLEIDRTFVENFCRKAEIRPGTSFVDYVRKELPLDALRVDEAGETDVAAADRRAMVRYGNRFSTFFYGREYGLRTPSRAAYAMQETPVLRAAAKAIGFAVQVRGGDEGDAAGARDAIRQRMLADETPAAIYRFLRRLFGQSEGPNVRTLLATLPLNYLRQVQGLLAEELQARVAAGTARFEEQVLSPLGGES